ncbi:MAG: tetratricopeptide repeat protein [Chitinivibrionales bacterium]|nr:tetratricopeptide repeat protein [Chitinivibrionales bacterium]
MKKNPARRQKAVIILISCFILLLCACVSSRGPGPAWYGTTAQGGRGYELFCQGNFIDALNVYASALATAERYDVIDQVALYRFNIGRVYFERGMPDSARFFLAGAYTLYRQRADKSGAGRAAGFLALAFCKQGILDSAWAWYKAGLPDKKKSEEKAFWLTVYGRIFWQEKHDQSALNYFEEAYRQNASCKRLHAMALLNYYRAGIYAYGHDTAEAVRLLTEGLKRSERAPEQYDRSKMLLRLAALLACRNELDMAQQYYVRARNTLPQGATIVSFENLKSCPRELTDE